MNTNEELEIESQQLKLDLELMTQIISQQQTQSSFLDRLGSIILSIWFRLKTSKSVMFQTDPRTGRLGAILQSYRSSPNFTTLLELWEDIDEEIMMGTRCQAVTKKLLFEARP